MNVLREEVVLDDEGVVVAVDINSDEDEALVNFEEDVVGVIGFWQA